MWNYKIRELDDLVDKYRIYPDNDDDFKGTVFLPIRDDAPQEIKNADRRLKEIYREAREKGFAV